MFLVIFSLRFSTGHCDLAVTQNGDNPLVLQARSILAVTFAVTPLTHS